MTVGGYSVMGISHFIVAAFLIALVMWGCPQYSVYEQGLTGQAALERAKQDRQILREEAQAKLDAAELLNQAEIARARGLKEATALVAESFGGPEAYLRYLWIQEVAGSGNNLIYIPTEAGMPLLEANRLGN